MINSNSHPLTGVTGSSWKGSSEEEEEESSDCSLEVEADLGVEVTEVETIEIDQEPQPQEPQPQEPPAGPAKKDKELPLRQTALNKFFSKVSAAVATEATTKAFASLPKPLQPVIPAIAAAKKNRKVSGKAMKRRAQTEGEFCSRVAMKIV